MVLGPLLVVERLLVALVVLLLLLLRLLHLMGSKVSILRSLAANLFLPDEDRA